MQIGTDVFIRRSGVLPHWFRWQGLPGTIVKIEGVEYTVRMSNGDLIGFYEDELVDQADW